MNKPLEPKDEIDGLREAFFRHTQKILEVGGPHSICPEARAFLHDCGFDLREVDRLPMGYFPGAEAIGETLLGDGFSAEEISASNLLADSRLPGRLIGPIRAVNGRILSFWARPPQPGGTQCLYLSGEWKRRTALIGLDVALPAVANGRQDLVIVEDLLEALLFQVHGIPYVAAIGNSSSEMTDQRWQRLAELGIQRVTLAPDSSRSTSENIVSAIEYAAQAEHAPAVYVLPPEAFSGPRGPWEFVRANGAEAFADILTRRRLHGFRYKALTIVAAHKPDHHWTAATRRAALNEASAFYATVHQRNIPQLDAFFLPALLDGLGLGWDRPTGWGQQPWGEESLMNGSPQESAKSQPKPPAPKLEAPKPEVRSWKSARRSRSSEFCEFHQCDRQICLCWD